MSTVRYPAMVFDLDGTLVDSVYQHVLAWREALEEAGIHLAVWRIHRRIGMSGGLLVNALLREVGRRVSPEEVTRMQQRHAAAYLRQFDQVRPLPGAPELLRALADGGVPHAIATSSRSDSAGPALRLLGVGAAVPVVTREQVEHAKPDPDLFIAAAARLGVPIHEAIVVGDSVWDSAGRPAGSRSGGGPALRWLRPGRIGARGRVSGLPGAGGLAAASG